MNQKLVPTIGWVSVALGLGSLLFLAFNGAVGLLVIWQSSRAAHQGHQNFDAASAKSSLLVFTGLGLVATIWAIFAGVGVVGRRSWGRTMLVGLGWFLVVACVSMWMAEMLDAGFQGFPVESTPTIVRMIAKAVETILMIPPLGLVGAFLWFIRRPTVRAAFTASSAQGQPNNRLKPPAGGGLAAD